MLVPSSQGSTSFWMCKARCWRWLFGNEIPMSLSSRVPPVAPVRGGRRAARRGSQAACLEHACCMLLFLYFPDIDPIHTDGHVTTHRNSPQHRSSPRSYLPIGHVGIVERISFSASLRKVHSTLASLTAARSDALSAYRSWRRLKSTLCGLLSGEFETQNPNP